MLTATIGQWGDASAVRIPRSICERVGLSVGDSVSMFLDGDNRIVIERSSERYTLAARMEGWDGGRFQTGEYDWGEPVKP